ncbi:MAG: UDP-N-acetylglucosamine 4,6-dehydratase (inverting) [Rhodospirillales bacterium]|nr:UDP-N-acetylglucosamine 4,6-dehydratase (inverting) [Rhodospirillales bacterium]
MNPWFQPVLDLNGKSVLVTGGTGSFGAHFVGTVVERYHPRKLIVFSRDELKQYDMQQSYGMDRYPFMRYFIGDVRDRDRLEMAMRDVDIVVHAAAMKQIPAAEYNPFECIQTNVHGAENVVRAALRAKVGHVIALSSDKAVSPINLYGASKLAADKILVAANHISGDGGTRYAVVRYGNVLGSRGSVVPLYRRLKEDGCLSLPVTDERMTRFWITLAQGVDFVLSSLALMTGGEIFVPKIPSMSIVDLCRAVAPEMATHVVGIRPGEKLHEVMITEDDARTTLELADRYVIAPPKPHPKFDPEAYARLGATAVGEAFRYASNTNEAWLSGEDLHALLAAAG